MATRFASNIGFKLPVHLSFLVERGYAIRVGRYVCTRDQQLHCIQSTAVQCEQETTPIPGCMSCLCCLCKMRSPVCAIYIVLYRICVCVCEVYRVRLASSFPQSDGCVSLHPPSQMAHGRIRKQAMAVVRRAYMTLELSYLAEAVLGMDRYIRLSVRNYHQQQHSSSRLASNPLPYTFARHQR